MASYLFVHQNFPGQFLHVARALAARGDTVVAIGDATRLRERPLLHPKIRCVGYAEPRGANQQTHPYLRGLEAHVRRGQAVFRVARKLLAQSFRPDVVIAHPGWGEALFLRDAFPEARHINYLEFYYHAAGSDVGFDPEFPATIDDILRLRIRNATQLLSFDAADEGISPTAWQKSRYPDSWQPRIVQLHDGINTAIVTPDPAARVGAGDTVLIPGHEVVTYVARNLEPYRGFHTFMRAVPLILEQRRETHVLIVGGDEVSYGRQPEAGGSYRQHYLKTWGKDVDRARVRFLGRQPYADYLRTLQISSLHVYLTYPFVLSWSMLEAMSAGCLVLGSNTPPVTEVIRDGENGFLADFFDAPALAGKVAELLAARDELGPVRQAARETIRQNYDLNAICLPRLLAFLSAGRD